MKKRKPAIRSRYLPNTKNILAIGDLHEPFTLKGYLDFCKRVYRQYHCTHVVFMGDILDNHFTSYHETDPDGMSAGDEIDLAIRFLKKWHKAFPKADVCVGNHDRLVHRKAYSNGVSKRWIRDFSDVLETPGWNFVEEVIYDDVRYIHGEQGSARARARKDLISTVQGHRHSEAYTDHLVGETFRIFATQVGCGVDRRSYAMQYARAGTKPAIGVAVILNHGTQPVNILAKLKSGKILA